MPLPQTTRARLTLLGGLYFAQGVPWGFVTIAVALRLTGLGVGPKTLGAIIAAAQLPWTAKPLLGPLVDRLKHRRPLILGTEAGMALSLLALGLADPMASIFLPLVFLHNMFAAGQDVASDALALAVLTPEERGRANGVMSAGKYAGVLVGGSGLAWVGSTIGWPVATAIAAVLLLVPAALVMMTAEPARVAVDAGPVLRRVLRAFASRAALVGALFALVAGASDYFLYPLTFPLLRQQLGLPETTVTLLVTLGAAAAVVGSLLGGAVADRLGRRAALIIGAVSVATLHLAFAAASPWWNWLPVVVAYQLASSIAGGMFFSAALALFMDLTDVAVAATQFQIYMALLNVRGTWASVIGGHLAEKLPTPAMFVLAAVIELLPLILLRWIDVRARARPA